MKNCFTLAVSWLLSLCVFAQKNDVASFGKVEVSEMKIKECEFDPKAEAMVLFDVAELSASITTTGLFIDLDRHVRIKILSDKGLNNADVHIRFAYDEKIKNLTAQTYNLDESGNIVVTKVDKKLVYEKKLNKRFYELVFTFPEAKAGSIIEYKFKQENAGLGSWYFQKSIPVKYSRYKTDFPGEIEVYAAPFCILPYESKRESKAGRQLQFYSMSDIPALRDEPYISAETDYLQRIDIRAQAINLPTQRINLLSSWPGIVKSLVEDEDFGVQLKREIPRTSDLDAELKKLSDPYSKMVTIHDYVRRNMEWNGYGSIWALNGVKSAWKDKKGTNGEINLILVNLLKDAGLNAAPILVSTRENGRISTTVAGYDQFNKVMAYVTIDDKVYVLDGTEKFTPPALIPLEVMTTEGLVIEKAESFKWGWKSLWDDRHMVKDIIQIFAVIDDKGKMKGTANVHSYDYSRAQRLPVLQSGKDKLLAKYFASEIPGFTTDSLELENDKVDTLPLVQRINFKLPLNSSGEYKYFPVNLFTGLEKNPFVADNRFSDVFFGANQFYQISWALEIPADHEFEALPGNVRMVTPDKSISMTRRFQANDNMLTATIAVEFKAPFYAVDDYPNFREFFKKMSDMLNEQIAIKKKK
jgi:hypothetical protein